MKTKEESRTTICGCPGLGDDEKVTEDTDIKG